MNFQVLSVSAIAQEEVQRHVRVSASASASSVNSCCSSNKVDSSQKISTSTSTSTSTTTSSIKKPKLIPMRNVFVAPLLLLLLIVHMLIAQVHGDGPNCMQNGMGPKNLYHNGEMNPEYMWSRQGSRIYVPVVMDETYTPRQLKRIIGGFKEIEQKTCVSFHYFKNHTVGDLDHVYVTKQREGCWSYIGRIGGRQEMSLPRGCMSHRTSVHEMIHALGFAHEHVRSDRDNYIVVHWTNIEPGRERNFVKRKTKSTDPFGPYDDYYSIMHYERGAFSVNGEDTITPKDDSARIGLENRMSYWDVKKVNRMYKCDNIFGGGDGGGGGVGGGFGYSPLENEISNFVQEGHGVGDVDADLDEDDDEEDEDGRNHLGHGHGHGHGHGRGHGQGHGHGDGHNHGHNHAVADEPQEIFGFESSHDDRPAHSPVHHQHPRSHSHAHQQEQRLPLHVDVDNDDDDYFRPTIGPFPTANRQRQSYNNNNNNIRGQRQGQDNPSRNNDQPQQHYQSYHHNGDGHRDGSLNGNGIQDDTPFSFVNTGTDFQFHEPRSLSPLESNPRTGASSFSFRDDNPTESNSNQFSSTRQPTVFDAPPNFFENCFPFC